MRFTRHVQLEKGHLDLAPMIDCVFLLLIFFLLTSNFIFQPGIKVNLPKTVTSEAIQEQSLVITITAENVIYLNEAPIAVRELAGEFKKAAARDRAVLIRADRRTSMGRVVEVWDLCQKEGIARVNIATTQ